MLLPALNQARETARGISCISTQKQLGLAMDMYVSDSDGFYPRYNGDGGTVIFSWVGRLFYTQYATGALFLCPSVKNPRAKYFLKNEITKNLQLAPDFGYNYGYVGARAYAEPTNPVRYSISAKRSRIKSPTKTICLTDIYNVRSATYAGYYYIRPYYATSGGLIDARHRGAVNVLWIDGHATAQKSVVNHPRPYSASANPYLGGVFMNGTTPGDVNNHFDTRR